MADRKGVRRTPNVMDRRAFLKLGGAGLVGATLLGSIGSGAALARPLAAVERDAREAGQKYRVPPELLLAKGYVDALLEMPPPSSGEYDPRSTDGSGGYGIMDLHDDPTSHTLVDASRLTRIPEEKLKTDRRSNILGAAALLAAAEGPGRDPQDLNSYQDSLAELWGGQSYAADVYGVLRRGFSLKTLSGETVALAPQPEAEPNPPRRALAAGEYPGSTWYGAHPDNHTVSNREASYDINKIVIHVGEGSFDQVTGWFQNTQSRASAHYTVGRAGQVGQSVLEKDVAWHAGWWDYNTSSVGIEHEGYASNPNSFTAAMYDGSARLSAYLAKKYAIPVDRAHIVGHNEVPGCSGTGGGADCHTDPGPYWDWTRYMGLVQKYAGATATAPTYSQVVDNTTAGRFVASSRWGSSSFSSQRYGTNYRFLKAPLSVTDNAKYKINTPSAGTYAVYAWWPAAAGYNPRTTYRIYTTSGWTSRVVDQRAGGGRWNLLGNYALAAGDSYRVQVSSRSSAEGYVVADAVRVVKR